MRVIKVKKNSGSSKRASRGATASDSAALEAQGFEVQEVELSSHNNCEVGTEFESHKGFERKSASGNFTTREGLVADVDIRPAKKSTKRRARYNAAEGSGYKSEIGGRDVDGDDIDRSGEQRRGSRSSYASKPRIEKGSFQDVYNRGVYLLSMREHGVRELATKLKQKFSGSSHVEEVISGLVEAGYLSDVRFAESYVRMRQLRGFGPIKIRSELNSKGIKNNMMEDFIDVKSSIWFELAEQAYEKKYGAEPVMDYQAWVKRARFMQSRGFTREHIDAVVPSVDYGG